MPRYIDADQIHPDMTVFLSVYSETPVKVYSQEYINKIPSANVSPVCHGRWVRKKALIQCDLCGFGLFPDGYFFKNGECTHSNEPSYRPNYCPNCGAKMDGGEGE